MPRWAGTSARGVRLQRWALLLLAVGCAYGVGRGCDGADPERNRADRPPSGTAGATPGVTGGGEGAKTPPPPARGDQAGGRVVRIRDGDSIVVLRDGVGVEVRLDGVDCPELAQAFGRKAKKFTSDLAFGKTVRLDGKGKDRYGRELAEVFLPDDRSLNRELVSAGFAWWYRKYSTDRTLETLERAARTARRGLWADPKPVPPWDFREAGRK